MASAQAQAVLTLDLQGDDVLPETLGIDVMAEFIQGARELAGELGVKADEVSLVRVRSGSVGLDFVTSEGSANALGPVIDHAATSPVTADELPSAWGRLARAVPEGTTLRVRQTFADAGYVEAFVEHLGGERHVVMPLTGKTTVYGRVRGVNLGVNGPTVRLDAIGRDRVLTCRTSEELAIRLGGRLREFVAMTGMALWEAETWELLSFTAERLVDVHDTDVVAAVERLAEASSGGWDRLDSRDVLERLRRS